MHAADGAAQLFWTNLNPVAYVTNMTGSAIWPWVIPVMETFALLSVVAATAALPPVRRRCYYVFYRAHLALPFLVLASLAHSWDAWQYALPGLLLYVADKLEAPRPVSNTRSHSPTLAPHLTPHRLPPRDGRRSSACFPSGASRPAECASSRFAPWGTMWSPSSSRLATAALPSPRGR